MNTDKVNRGAGIASADGNVRHPYLPPKLASFGKLVTLTQTGTMTGMEDFFQNGNCVFADMTSNMC